MNNPFTDAPGGPEQSNPPIPADDRGPEIVPDAPSADPAPDILALLKKAEDEAAAMKESYLRARADTENVRRQAQADVAKAHRYGIEKFAESLLPVKDALEQALATPHADPKTLREGVELTLRALNAAFEKAQLTVIDPLGQKFDPHAHQAIQMAPADQPENTVLQVLQKGYRLSDRVLRPAMVIVAGPRGGSR
ncbi:MAG TPA: nucleotide exchange factor GrpE [Casimicrobiaceae bacterium]|nr:nucleotide exchange factor GrpE [Casimicrobiaceae bacterium]